ncbi:OmpA family protein [Imbroritus primus]|uniref:OmpA family protein n=1 Tax=Imbroritus primus TaxID=3058603 RepID=UPI003D1615AB
MNRKSSLAACLLSLTMLFQAAASAAAPSEEQFPDPASSYRTEGLFPNVANLRNMSNGLTKPQVLDLLGAPHFSEGLFGVREWNYIFNLRDADGSVTQCQYKVLYDDQAKVRRTLWNKPQCADLIKERQPQPVAAQPVPEPVKLQAVNVSDQFTFEFGQADVASLNDDGQARLARLARDLRDLAQLDRVQIVGFADRIGNASANQALSQSRADTVRDFLVANGVPAARIRAEGHGVKTRAQCPGPKSQAVIRCLKGDRQVSVEAVGAR